MTLGVVGLVSLSGCGGGGTAEKADTSRVTSSASATDSASESASTVDSPTADTAKVTIGAVGYGLDEYGSAMAVATVTNPTSDVVSISVNFAAYDAAGTVLDTEEGGYVIVRSSSSQIVATDLSLPDKARIDHIDAQVSVDDSQSDDHPSSKMEIPSVDVLKKYGSFSATGQIQSHYESTISEVYVGVSCTDASDNIVGGGYTFLDSDVVGGSTAPFSASVTVSKPPVKCTAAATLSNLSEAS